MRHHKTVPAEGFQEKQKNGQFFTFVLFTLFSSNASAFHSLGGLFWDDMDVQIRISLLRAAFEFGGLVNPCCDSQWLCVRDLDQPFRRGVSRLTSIINTGSFFTANRPSRWSEVQCSCCNCFSCLVVSHRKDKVGGSFPRAVFFPSRYIYL